MAHRDTLETRIEALRIALRDATEFASVVDLFQHTLEEFPPLREASVQERNEVIEQSLAAGMGSLLGKDDPVVLVLFRVASQGMWHGFAFCGGVIGVFFGFDATRQLCLCVLSGDGLSHYLRISWKTTPTGLGPRGVRGVA